MGDSLLLVWILYFGSLKSWAIPISGDCLVYLRFVTKLNVCKLDVNAKSGATRMRFL